MRHSILILSAAASLMFGVPALAGDTTNLSVKPGMKPDTTITRCGLTVIKVALVAFKDDKELNKPSFTRVRSLTVNDVAVSAATLGWINGPRDGFDGGFQGISITCGDVRAPTVMVASNGFGQVAFEVDASGFVRKRA